MDEKERQRIIKIAKDALKNPPKHSEETSRSLWRRWSTDVITPDMIQEKDDKDKKS